MGVETPETDPTNCITPNSGSYRLLVGVPLLLTDTHHGDQDAPDQKQLWQRMELSMVEAAPSTPPPTSAFSTANPSRHTLLLLAAFYVLVVLSGLRNIYHSEQSYLDLLIQPTFAVCLGWWAVVDARCRHHPFPLMTQPWIILFGAVAGPGYVIWSRRWRGAGWLLLHLVLASVLANVVTFVGFSILFGNGGQPLPDGL